MPYLILALLAVAVAALARVRRGRLLVTLTGVALVATAVVVPVTADRAAAASTKVTICHRTRSTTNPYRMITVSRNGVNNGGHGGHRDATSPSPVFDRSYDYSGNNKRWEDIIPGGDADGAPYNGSSSFALNWTVAGKAAFLDPAVCKGMTAKQFYDSEVAAGTPVADILADLESQGANEDAALKAALGGSFIGKDPTTFDTLVSATTSAASSVAATTATLNGTLKVGATSTVTKFEYGTSAALGTTVAATPTPVTNETAVSVALTGLAAGTTYHFRVVGVTNEGLETEGILYGATLTFTTSAAAARTLTIDASSYDVAGYVLGGSAPTITSTPSAGAGTKSYSSSTSAVCTVGAASGVVTLVAAGTCTIAASITAEGAYAAATATAVSFPVAAGGSTTTTSTTAPPATTTTTAPPATTTTTEPPPPTTSTTAPATTTTVPATTTTTVPPTTTTTAAPPTPPEVQSDGPADVPATSASVRGVVWFDRNRNAAFDGREWILPGVEVTLTEVQAPAAAFAAAAAVTEPAPPTTLTLRTAADGSYAFTGLEPGSYRIQAAARIKGFDYTSDTDGASDWAVDVEVPADQQGVADFAGLGRGELGGTMYETGTRRGLAFATITCVWGGYDDALGNGDDVPFQVAADAEGVFDMLGVPYGNFSCSGVDDEGRTASAPAVAVFSPERVEAELPVPTGAMLPRTGTTTAPLALAGVALITLGGFVEVASRRRSRRADLRGSR